MNGEIINRIIKTPVGELIIGSFNEQLCLADWRYRKMRNSIDQRITKRLQANFKEGNSEVLIETERQLEQFFNKSRKTFDLPLLLVGTDFQKRVWNALLEIPYAKTSTYLELSQKLGNEKAIRAIASANGANAISIIIPCHRIIGSNSKLIGYAGGLQTKKKLLELEGGIRTSQLDLFS